LVKLNVCVANENVADDVRRFLGERLKNLPAVAVSFVQSRLPHPAATLGIDAVVIDDRSPGFGLRPRTESPRLSSAILPAIPRLYVSGQAEKGADLAEATRKTLVSLQSTLKHLGGELASVVQVKCFLSPMSEVAAAEREIAAFFGNRIPPCVFVEWQSTLPIEIELIASVWPKSDSTEPLEFITPPGMTASPVFCRVVRVNDPRTIFVSGLFARETGDGAAQVSDVFAQLQDILKASGSDLRHLAKATYYVSDNDASAKLNELRPKFYDPARPPAASKAQVLGVGMAGRSLTLDMIAVPAK
jgi:enamine deaminase RidA (YjgF/YER057c/UK114 family)